jgi:L-asparaginase / beta-aspartyl-peptidase
MKHKISLAIHGGAGTILREKLTPELEKEYLTALEDALRVGYEILKNNGTSLDAVEAAVISLEDFPLFNAGKGSVFSSAGTNEMDASVMDGKTLNAGAVTAIKNIKNPIKLARKVMENSKHVLLSGEGAIEFSKKYNIEFADDKYFFVQQRWDAWKKIKGTGEIVLDHNEKKFGTVGAVACDINGNLAAATSTGGMTNKQFGRVGDCPIIGAGNYANNNTCAVSCTGDGEFFMRSLAAYDVSCLMEYKNLSLNQACEFVVKDKLVKIGGEGGLIAVDKNGNTELCFNSAGMYRGWVENGEFKTAIF